MLIFIDANIHLIRHLGVTIIKKQTGGRDKNQSKEIREQERIWWMDWSQDEVIAMHEENICVNRLCLYICRYVSLNKSVISSVEFS